jgi:flagellar hook-associated protein FlgK
MNDDEEWEVAQLREALRDLADTVTGYMKAERRPSDLMASRDRALALLKEIT